VVASDLRRGTAAGSADGCARIHIGGRNDLLCVGLVVVKLDNAQFKAFTKVNKIITYYVVASMFLFVQRNVFEGLRGHATAIIKKSPPS